MAEMSKSKKWWSDEEVKDMLVIISEMNLNGLIDSKKTRSKALYEEAERLMQLKGHSKSWEQIRNKFKSMKCDYHKPARHNSKSGADRMSFPFFQELQNLFGDRPVAEFTDSVGINVGQEDDYGPEALNLASQIEDQFGVSFYYEADDVENAEESSSNNQAGGSSRSDTRPNMITPVQRQLSRGDGSAAKRRKKYDATTLKDIFCRDGSAAKRQKKYDATTLKDILCGDGSAAKRPKKYDATTLKEIFAEHREWEEKQMKETMKQHQEIMMQSVAQLCTKFSAEIQAIFSSQSQTLPTPPSTTQSAASGPG